MATVCKRVHYSGRVQGVGFRYTAAQVARGFPVAGSVRNLANGQVELVAEGSAEEVADFLSALSQRMAGHIQDQIIEDETPTGTSGFVIRH